MGSPNTVEIKAHYEINPENLYIIQWLMFIYTRKIVVIHDLCDINTLYGNKIKGGKKKFLQQFHSKASSSSHSEAQSLSVLYLLQASLLWTWNS